jgi:hypothetical protein
VRQSFSKKGERSSVRPSLFQPKIFLNLHVVVSSADKSRRLVNLFSPDTMKPVAGRQKTA